MDSIFLAPEATTPVSIRTKVSNGKPVIEITDGGPYLLRTATGREYGRVQAAIAHSNVDAQYEILPSFLVGGIDPKDIEKLHPNVVAMVLIDVLNRSRVSEVQSGK